MVRAWVVVLAFAGITVGQSESGSDHQDRIVMFGFGVPSPEFPYHHIVVVVNNESIEPRTVTRVEADGRRNRNVRVFNVELSNLATADSEYLMRRESYEKRVAVDGDVFLVMPVMWTNGSEHTVRIEMETESGIRTSVTHSGTAPSEGGHWDVAWRRSISVTLRETAGLDRRGEPVHLSVGVFSSDVKVAAEDVRVVSYDPDHPDARADGYTVAPCQVTSVQEWRDEKVLAIEEKDSETGERIRRYDPTTTIDLVFLADVAAGQEKVYQVLYGNPDADAIEWQTDLNVEPHEDLGQTIETGHYQIGLATNSGAVETVKILGPGTPVLLEHKLETNGAVHWNPGCYAPPTPWVHASDWEKPESRQISGSIMHRTRRFAALPHMDSVFANVAYTFYANQPYMISSSLMEVREEIFVKALRNAEIVFNHAVLNEFVWKDPSGEVKSLAIDGSRKHPVHALEIAPDTPWMAFINREQKVGFASILLAYENSNMFGDPAGEAQPYIYVQNGPWIYWSRGMVYPFGGANLTRLMRVRKGSVYLEKNAYVPFRLADEDDPFAAIERLRKQLTQPLLVHEWMATDDRTPESWIMPLLTMPFDEGVAEAVGSQEEGAEPEQD
ncbi:MAG: hypothetical protein CMJ49_05285 [Planctomycetaceae bacterium]|nr:hypothetical protein [Planctomycetaceae bacterium]